MKKIVLISLVICAMLFCACGKDENSGFGDNLGQAVSGAMQQSGSQNENSQSVTVPNSSSSQIESTAPVGVDYSAYSSILYAYEKTMVLGGDFSEEASRGMLYAELIDLNKDDVFELIIGRVFETGEYATPTNSYLDSDFQNRALHVFALDEHGGVVHVEKFPFAYAAFDGMYQYTVEYLEIDGVIHMITDTNGGYGYTTEHEYWTYDGVDMQYAFNIGFESYMNDQQIYEYEFYKNADVLDSDEYDKMQQATTVHVVNSNIGTENYTEITAQTAEFLKDYPVKNFVSTSAVFNDGSFVIVEDDIENGYMPSDEKVVVDFIKAMVAQDYDAMYGLSINEEFVDYVISRREDNSFYPGIIIENVDFTYASDIKKDSLLAFEKIIMDPYISQGGYMEDMYSFNHFGLGAVAIQRRHFFNHEVNRYTGQETLDNVDFYLTDISPNGDVSVATMQTSVGVMENEMYENAFLVEFLGFEDDVLSRTNDGSINLEDYIRDDQILNIDYYETEFGNEVYLIESLWGKPLKVYEYSLTDDYEFVRGELLYESNSEVLYLICNAGDLAEVEIVVEAFDGFELTYHPQINPRTGEVNFGYFGGEFPWIY